MNNNYQYNLSNMLSVYQSNLLNAGINLFNLHWNLVGESFFPLHVKLGEYYEKIFEYFDVIAERIKQLNGFPVTTLKDFSDLSAINSQPSKDYNQKEAVLIVINNFSYLLDITKQIMNNANQINDQVTLGILGEQATFYEKQLWMLKANLK